MRCASGDPFDEERPCHVRFVEAADHALGWLDTAVLIVDEEGELHPAAAAALEAARASIVAMVRAELADPWWEDARPPVAELIVQPTPAGNAWAIAAVERRGA